MSYGRRVVLVLVLFLAIPLWAQTEGAITGTVTDSIHGGPLPGALVAVRDTSIAVQTDSSGTYRLTGIPIGKQSLEVTFLGFRRATVDLDVPAGSTVTRDVVLDLDRVSETVVVTGEPLSEGQAKALNQQKNALNIQSVVASDQIGEFPDSNSAEAAQRIPGVSIERDQGEGRYVLIRGTEPRLNAMMLNGDRIPSPEGEVRAVALDVVPADVLQSIEVSKTLTPNMDGDAIGGAVNLVTRSAGSKPITSLSLAGGWNDLSDDSIRSATGTFGRPISETFSILAGGSWLETDRGSQNFEASWEGADLEEMETRHYTVGRKRYGAFVNADAQIGSSTNAWFRGSFNQFDDQEFRRRAVYKLQDDEIERELKDRFESQQIMSFSTGATQLIGGRYELDYRAAWLYSEEEEPRAWYSTFVQEDVSFDPSSGDPSNLQPNPSGEDFGSFVLDDVAFESNQTDERDLVLAANLGVPFMQSPELGGRFRFGFKYRGKQKSRDQSTLALSPEDDILLTDVADREFGSRSIVGGHYETGLTVSSARARELARSGVFEEELDPEADLGDFEADENILAGYVMTELFAGRRLAISGGLRYERSDADYTGYEVLFDDEGDHVATRPLRGSRSDSELLPMINLRYGLSDSDNLRAAFTRSLARPNYFQLAPYQLILEEDREIERGNPDLELTTAWNADLMYERYLQSVGLFSAGVFWKSLEDYIYPLRTTEERNGDEYEVLQPFNGETATLRGAELALQSRFSKLPAPFDSLGIYVNYTWTDSKAQFPDRDGDSTLPGQASRVGNAALTWERNGFSARMAANFHGKYVSEVGEDAESDVYVDDHTQLDFTASYALRSNLSLYVELLNLTDEPLRLYMGRSSRPIQEEYYSWWGTIGMRWRL